MAYQLPASRLSARSRPGSTRYLVQTRPRQNAKPINKKIQWPNAEEAPQIELFEVKRAGPVFFDEKEAGYEVRT